VPYQYFATDATGRPLFEKSGAKTSLNWVVLVSPAEAQF
jgi:hypothetical protein